ncbi:MAG TPA: tRNA pseudouridine(55) synthase TruB [Oligoflexia bacterium]|nr:tRNA pseudouridine(55) synthase TruB [Oligoflexia bacterium]
MKSGIILVDKPAGSTSFDCIRDLKRAWKRSDLGHCGTLDRFATGLLPILVGDGLKLVRFFLESYPNLPTYWKTYQGVLLLGRQTATGDPEGEVLHDLPVPESIDRSKIEEAMKTFENAPYAQTPPAYSAKKIEGSRASDLAREGKLNPESLKAVDVTIELFRLIDLTREGDKVRVRFEARCSKGTYVRRLAEDLGQKLGTHGTLLELCRTHVGSFKLSDAKPLSELCTTAADDAILDMGVATSFLPRMIALDADVEAMKKGQFAGLHARLANADFPPNVYCAATVAGDRPVALLELRSDQRIDFLRAFQI